MRMLILVTILTFIGLFLVAYDPSEDYWNKVGYEMDRTLNPNKYEVEAIKGEGNG